MRSAMSDLLRQIILINFSLDLNLGARASLCISFLQIIVRHLGYFILSGFPVDFVKVRGFLEPVNDMDCREGSAGPCSISPVFNRVWGGIISFEFVTIVTTIKGEEVLIYHLWTLPAHPAPPGTIPSYRKDQVDVAPNRRCDRCRCFTLN